MAYFRSGWAFLIPYLAAYLLYAWLKWPVNPVAAGSSPVDGGQLAVSAIGALPSTGTPSTAWSSPPFTFTLTSLVPPLLHVYWFLHALHLVLGALALRAWWKGSGTAVAGATDDSESVSNRAAQPLLSTVPQSGHRLPLPGDWPGQTPGWQQPATAINRPPSAMDRLWAAMPWLLLALLFYIPGVYLEFPADPWQHYGRINEWPWLQSVMEHSAWKKSSYFLAYSLIGQLSPPMLQLKWLDIYYTSCCLLLCWQYYRLSRAVGLGERASFIFVLIQSLTIGNNIFGFYRYYGISSTIFAQFGVIALIRTMLIAAQSPLSQITHRPWILGRWAMELLLLVGFIAFNHGQGLGIGLLGISAVLVWRLILLDHRALVILVVAGLLANFATVAWWPQNPSINETYQPQGWITSWYGFNIFSPLSPAGESTLRILGLFGVINLIAGLLLVWRNHIVGWITLIPIVALTMPFITIPLANAITTHTSGELTLIYTFHRMLLGVPSGLALISLFMQIQRHDDAKHAAHNSAYFTAHLAPLALLLLLTLPCSAPFFNRFWNLSAVAPADLSAKYFTSGAWAENLHSNHYDPPPLVAAGPEIGYMISATGFKVISYASKGISQTTLANRPLTFSDIVAAPKADIVLIVPSFHSLYSPSSQSGFLSGHWLPQEVAWAYSSGTDFSSVALQNVRRRINDGASYYFLNTR